MSLWDDAEAEFYGAVIPAFLHRKVNERMSQKGKVAVLRGTLHWAKVLGAPRDNEFTGGRDWSVDLTPDDPKALKELGIADKLREPKGKNDDRKERFLSFRQKEFRENQKTGEVTKNEPIRVTDARGEPWPDNKLIGNGTKADVKFLVKEYKKGMVGTYIQAIRILDHVPYAVDDFAPLSEEDEFFAAPEGDTVEDELGRMDEEAGLDDA